MEFLSDTVKSIWAIVKPQLAKILALILVFLMIYLLISRIIWPAIFPDKAEQKIEKLEQITNTQKTTIQVLQQANEGQSTTIEQLGQAAVATDTALGEILAGRTSSSDKLINNLDHTNSALSQIKTDKALANQNTKQLIERKAQQKLIGEDTSSTDKLISQSLEAAKALDQKHAKVVIDSLWSMYDDVNK